ncbi:SGNH/GDSL hydrolase family protein [Streptomyces sp. F63]|uniref:SGNH/GDSL hydrolase family protein n=1 Tax=Streptomyces sp. F63 TaxID=2824887 RepID=UPI001B36DDEF|nr:SGNH/GDSL hydrolase family protein [Streptomyces sp. F63]MBQ0985155.1 SGNH/GDSL hydrolase family protein [Streptomyces sp. F63]
MNDTSTRTTGPRGGRRPGPWSRVRAGAVALLTGILLAVSAPAAPATTPGPLGAGSGPARTGPAWTGTWGAAPTTVPASDDTVFEDQTLRQIVRVSRAGETLRVRFSNEFGTERLRIGEARVARRAGGEPGSSIDPATDRRLTFGGRRSVTVPPGAPLLSDPVTLRVPAGTDLVVSIHLPRRTPGSTVTAFAHQTNYVADGNVTGRTHLAAAAPHDRWYFLTGVSVAAHRPATAVALGDSITAGTSDDANNRWSDVLARRLQEHPALRGTGVVNKGISGNRLLHDPNPPEGHPAEAYAAYFGESGLARFDRDVLAQPGARYAMVLLGVNDLGHPGTIAPESERVTAEDLINGHRQLIARAHERGLKIYGGTVTPFKNDTLGFYSEENEAARQRLNHWIRTSGAYDGVIDFDRAVRDPQDPERLLPAYDSGDHLHPNDAGLTAMGRAVPLRLFR